MMLDLFLRKCYDIRVDLMTGEEVGEQPQQEQALSDKLTLNGLTPKLTLPLRKLATHKITMLDKKHKEQATAKTAS